MHLPWGTQKIQAADFASRCFSQDMVKFKWPHPCSQGEKMSRYIHLMKLILSLPFHLSQIKRSYLCCGDLCLLKKLVKIICLIYASSQSYVSLVIHNKDRDINSQSYALYTVLFCLKKFKFSPLLWSCIFFLQVLE